MRGTLAIAALLFLATAAPSRRLPLPKLPPPPDPLANITWRTIPEPPVKAPMAIVIDAVSGRVLWGRNIEVQSYPASTTKILTGLLLAENTAPDDRIRAPKDVQTIGEASLHLMPGEVVPSQDLLYGMMLRSANDACYAAAVHMAGSVDQFAQMMNARASLAGCTHSNFVNPNGLHDPNHYTCVHDLALLGRAAMRNGRMREVVRTTNYTITRSTNLLDRWIKNHNVLLGAEPGLKGIKTGYTVPAGRCFVGYQSNGKYSVITAVMKSPDWRTDHKALARWALAQFELREVGRSEPSKVRIGEYEVSAKADCADLALTRLDANETVSFGNITPFSTVPEKGEVCGTIAVLVNGKPSGRIPAICTDVNKVTSPLQMMTTSAAPKQWNILWVALVTGLASVMGWIFLNVRSRTSS
ncbi:MAG: D-alanyl-D-alanine carboxypeptidase [Armatimonadetes bacterium]|nr:D-alanyl-D-alanine carboxypeptidase [Armatimonadota bacterium]